MRTESSPLGELLFGQTRGRILRLLFGHPDQLFFVRQIARETSISVGSVQRELEALSQVGLIVRSTSGHQVYHQANRNHPVFAEIHALVAKTVGVFQLLSSALAPLAQRISQAFVYGSVASRSENAESDVDLMIVGDVTLDETLAQLASVEPLIGRTINPTIYSSKEFESKLQSGNHFLRSVMRSEKVFLIGAEDDSRKVG
ncbi:nucleotidyltransferase [Acidicapsa acidisoli]|uniref:nucleotidyltransferase n=1 Tax=Acidicapsa acidisoli TaxID=1615681 RepID=UPI0021E0EA73|nr:nucleotidyltransferase [Acidicapsa acidisoli]